MEEGRQRRSARLSALDKCKQERTPCGGVLKLENRAADGKGSGRGQKLPGKKRGRKKKKLQEVEETVVNAVDKVVGEEGQNLQQDGYRHSADTTGNSSSSRSCLPEKQLLELILDVLQRKDTHEVFAEPVDPEEVEGYYDIIKNPMDFGTMRAKLQEGMYASLEQFEHDVFLICSNAMLFNSPSTVFFRQARSIQELAKKAFHALRTDPENFKLEFSSKRGRYFLNQTTKSHVNRTSQADTGNSDSNAKPGNSDSNAKPATGEKSINLTDNIAANDRQRPLQGYSGLKRSLHERLLPCGPSALVENQRTSEDLSGSRDGRKSNLIEEERRFTYRPWTSFLNSNESLISTLSNGPRQLSYAILDNISYIESLHQFVKDLGPTAQMVAQQKLQKCQNQALDFQTPGRNFQTPAVQPETPAWNFVTPAKPTGQLTPIPSNSGVHFTASRLDDISFHSNRVNTANKNDIFSTATRETLHQNQSSEISKHSHIPSRFGNSDMLVALGTDSINEYLTTAPGSGLSGNPTHSGGMTSEYSQLRLLERMLRNNNSMVTSPSWFQAMKAPGSREAADSMQKSSSRTSDEKNQAAVSPPMSFQVMKASSSSEAARSVHNSCFRTSDEENPPVASPPWPLQAMKAPGSSQAANSMHSSWLCTSVGENQTEVLPPFPFQARTPSGSSQAANSMHDSYLRTTDEENQAMASSSWPLKFIKASGSNQDTDSMHTSCFYAFDENNQAVVSPSWPLQAMEASGSNQVANSERNSFLHTHEEKQATNSPSWHFQDMKASGSSQAANPVHNFSFHTSDEENQAAASPFCPLQASKASSSSQAAYSMHYSYTSPEENQAAASSFWPFQAMKPSGLSQGANSMHKSNFHAFGEENQSATMVAPDLNSFDSAQMGQSTSWGRPELWGPQAVLDMSYLQARLGGMNSWGQNGISKPELPPVHVSETVFADDHERHAGHNLQGDPSTQRLFDTQPDLALQL